MHNAELKEAFDEYSKEEVIVTFNIIASYFLSVINWPSYTSLVQFLVPWTIIATDSLLDLKLISLQIWTSWSSGNTIAIGVFNKLL